MEKGAHLTSVLSEEENTFLSSLDFSAALVYIGGQRDENEFSWSDGNNFDYQNWWWSGQSNNNPGSCAVMFGGDGTWGLRRCNDDFKYICKKSSGGNT